MKIRHYILNGGVVRVWTGLVLILFFGPGCRLDPSGTDTAGAAALGADYDLAVARASVRLWSEPGLEGEVITRMPAGTQLIDLDQVSDFTSRIQINGKNYDEPWIKVRTQAGQEGWVYASVEDFQLASGLDSTAWSYEKRLLAYLGAETVAQLAAYRQAFQQIRSQADFVQVYRQGMELRDRIVRLLEDKTALLQIEALPDLFWLGAAMPGFVPQLVAEGTAYYLFADYRQWLPRARQTAERADDSFVDLCIYFFPQDSVEYFFPVWKIQTWDYGGHSLLGRGYHLGALQKMDQLLRTAKVFEPSVQAWRKNLLDDIIHPEATYWEEQTAALAELDQILAAGFACLTKEDEIALEVRRRQMENAKKYGIEFNHRAGIY